MKRNQIALAAALAALLIGHVQAQTDSAKDAAEVPKAEKAADTETGPQVLQRVEVTGSHISRINGETAAPIEVIKRQDIERSGLTSVGDLMRQSTAQGSIDINENQQGTYTPGAQAMNLRSLGAQATLVLLNGRRMVSYPRAAGATFFNDLNSIPLDAVDRIEILKDGASALYGSDAIAGVVNIILRRDFTGVVVKASAGRSTYGDAGRRTAAIAAGAGDFHKQGWNVWGNLEVEQRDPYLQGNRSDSYIGNRDARPWGWINDLSRYSTTGNLHIPLKGLKDDPATGRQGVNTLIIPLRKDCAADKLYAHPATNYGGMACWYDEFKDTQTQAGSESRRVAFSGRASFKVNQDLEVYGQLVATQNAAEVRRIPEVYGPWQPVSIGPSHPQYPKASDLPAGYSLADLDKVQITYTFGDIGGAGAHVGNHYTNFSTGARGVFRGWDWDIGLSHQQAGAAATRVGELLKQPTLDAIAQGKYLFGGPNDPALLKSMQGNTTDVFRTSLSMADVKLSNNQLFKLPGGDAAIALGLEARQETYFAKMDPLASSGAFLSIVTMPDGWDIGRNVLAAYSELSLPLVKNVEAQVALRHDRYSDAGSATKPKLAMTWRPMPQFMLRGSYAGGFRAPGVLDVRPLEIQSGGQVWDPQRCLNGNCEANTVIANGGNPDLKPETAKSTFIGFVAEPMRGLAFSLDYWKIQRDNEIADSDPQDILNHPERYGADAVVRGPMLANDPAAFKAGPITLIRAFKRNLASTESAGVDFALDYVQRTAKFGKFNYRLQGTQFTRFAFKSKEGDDWYDTVGINQFPKLRYSLSLGWELGNFNLGLTRHTTGAFSATNPDDNCKIARDRGLSADLCQIKAFSYLDLNIGYRGLIKGLELQASVNNLSNAIPPLNVYDGGQRIFGGLHSSMGRYMQVHAKYSF